MVSAAEKAIETELLRIRLMKVSQIGGSHGQDLVGLEFAQIQQMNDSSKLKDLMPKQAQMKVDH